MHPVGVNIPHDCIFSLVDILSPHDDALRHRSASLRFARRFPIPVAQSIVFRRFGRE